MKRNYKQLLALIFALITAFAVLTASASALEVKESCDYSIEGRTEIYDPDNMPYYDRFSFFDVGSAQFNGCFGNQLTGETKSFYDSMVEYYVDEKNTGNFEFVPSRDLYCVLQFDTENNRYLNEEELDVLHSAICSVVFDSCDAFLRDYPEVFWFRNASFSSSYKPLSEEAWPDEENSNIVNVPVCFDKIVYKPVEIYTDAHKDVAEFDASVNTHVNTIKAYFGFLGSDATRADKLKYMHDYISANSDYDTVGASDSTDLATHSAQPFFIGDGLHVCEGYAKVLKIFCDREGIPCVCVSGKNKDKDYPDDREKDGHHMWNYVQMEDGKWYLIDITWDDQELKTYDTYFLANRNSKCFYFDKIENERYEVYSFSKYTTGGVTVNGKEFVYPVLSSEEYTGHTHSWIDSEIIKEANCREKGEKIVKCENGFCGETKTVITDIDSNSHSYTSEITTPATHLEQGVETFSCPCGESYTKSIEKLPGHTYTSEITTPATHLKQGVETFSCPCGESYTKIIEKLPGHIFTSSVVTAPTCKAEGYTTYYCECGYEYTSDVVAKLAHSEEIIPATESTCTTAGQTEGKRCTLCGTVTVKPALKPLKSHSYKESAVKQATCTSDGYTTYTCENCSSSYNGSYVSGGHSYENGVCTACGDNKAESCSHMCHKNGFIWKILRFFFKLFRIQPTCECGVKHY